VYRIGKSDDDYGEQARYRAGNKHPSFLEQRRHRWRRAEPVAQGEERRAEGA